MGFVKHRFYLQDAAAAISPSFKSWTSTADAIRRKCSLTQAGTGPASNSITTPTGSSSITRLLVQFVSDPLGWKSPAVLAQGMMRVAADPIENVTPPLRRTSVSFRYYFCSIDGVHRVPGGAINAFGNFPPVYYSGAYLTSTTEATKETPPPQVITGTPYWAGTFTGPGGSFVAQYLRWPDVVEADRLVLEVGFSLVFGTTRNCTLYYGDSGSPADIANPAAAGHPFFDLFLYVPGSGDSITYTRPRARVHRPDVIDATEDSGAPDLNEDFWNG